MSKFDAVYKKIEEQLPVSPVQTSTPPTTGGSPQSPLDPKLVQQLQDAIIAAADKSTASKTLETIMQALNPKPGQQPVPNQQANQQQKMATLTTTPSI